jgi:hypothetical protein
MENDKLYRILFYIGCGWNFAIAASLFILLNSLPTMLNIDPPRHTLFIYFNLSSIFIFGCMQLMVARNLHKNRNMVIILMWAKFTMIIMFVYALIFDAPVKELTSFLAPGMVIDFIFGLIFWRFLVYSRSQKIVAATE